MIEDFKLGRKLIIDISLIGTMVLGAITYNKEVPGGLLLLFFPSMIYSILLLLGGIYLFTERVFNLTKLLSLPYGLIIFVAPLSYSFRILDFPGYEVLTLYSRLVLPLLFITFIVLAITKEDKDLRSFCIINLIRLFALLVLVF